MQPESPALVAAEERFRTLAGLFVDWYWVLDRDLRYVHISGQGDRRNNVDAASLLGQRRFEGREFEPLDMGKAEFERLHAEGRSYRDVRARIRVKGGGHHYISISGEPLKDALGALAGYHGVTRDITKEYLTQAALAESEARFRSLADLSSDFYWETDAEHRFVHRVWGEGNAPAPMVPDAVALGRRRWEIPSLSPDAAGWRVLEQAMDAHQPFRGFEFSRRDAEGTERHFTVSGEPVFDRHGAFTGYRGVGTDITARKREERLLALEHEVTRRLALAPSAAEGLRAVIRAICEAQGWDYGRYWKLDEAAGVLRFGAAWCIPDPEIERYLEESRGLTFAPGVAIVGEVLRTGEPVLVADLSKDGRLQQQALAERAGLRGACNFAVNAEGRTVGVLALVGRIAREDDPRLLSAMGAIGRQLGQFLRQKMAEDEVRASEARFRSLVALSSDFYWESDREHRIMMRTGGVARALDQAGGNVVFGKRRWELDTVAPDAAGWEAHRADLDARRVFRNFEFAWVGGDGNVYHLSISGEPVFDAAGGFTGYRGIGSDITSRRHEEQLQGMQHEVARMLAEAGEPLRAVESVMRAVCGATGFDCARFFRLDAATGMMRQAGGWSADPALLERFVTEAAKRDFAPGEGVVGEVWRSGRATWVEDIARDPRFVNAAAASGASLRTGFTVPIAFDGRIEGALTFLSVRQRAEDALVLRSARAVASQLAQYLARARSQQLLRENEERFRSLTELSSDWYWEQDAELRFVNFSGGNIPRKWGVDQLNAIGKRREEIPGVVAVSSSWEAHRADLEARRPYRNFVYMRVHKETGQSHYVSASGYPVFDAAGRFTGYRGVATDVTERVRGERLREMEHRISSLLAAGDDPIATLVAVMRAVCESMGIDCGRYYEAGEAGEVLRFVGGWGVADAEVQRFLAGARDTRFRRGERISGVVWETGEAIWVADVAQDPRTAGTPVAASGMRSMLGVPVVADGQTVGVLSFTSRQMRAPDEAVLHALSAIGSQLGQFLGRARSQAELRRSSARLELHARRQERIAGFGQFALRRQGADQLIEGALQALGPDIEAAVFFERDDQGRLRLREGRGAAVAESIGKTAPLIPGGAASRVLDGGETVRVEDAYFSALPEGLPWAEWIRRMRSGVYVPVTHNGHAHGMLALFSEAPGAFEDDDVRFAESVGHVLSAALQREQAEQRLAIMAQFDSLTGLPNRGLLEDRLRQTMAQSRRKQWQTGVLFVDLDRFKLVNDTLGHPVGDRLLREVSARLQLCVRADDTVGRISGDEFAIVLADLAHAEDAAKVAQKVLDALAQPFALEASEVFVSASIGISVYPADGEDAETLLRNADMAMYRAKKASRNAYRFFTAKMNERTARKLQLGTDLRRAIDRREFTLHYQPKVELPGGTLVGMEALLRWNHPARGLVSPAEFVPALEESGLIMPVGEWVLEEACAQLKRWRDAGYVAAPVSINLSPKQFRRQDLDKVIQRALEAAGLPPALLELEITESSIADDPEQAVAILRNLRAAGMAISVDDFGTGYSSLAYLTRLPISSLKIDRSFVSGADESPESVSIVRAIIDMAHNMRFTVVAEGVETEWQAKFLRLYNCDQAQGYLFGRPVPAAEIEGRLAKAVG